MCLQQLIYFVYGKQQDISKYMMKCMWFALVKKGKYLYSFVCIKDKIYV